MQKNCKEKVQHFFHLHAYCEICAFIVEIDQIVTLKIHAKKDTGYNQLTRVTYNIRNGKFNWICK